MLRLLVNILFIALVYRMIRSVLTYLGRSIGGRADNPSTPRPAQKSPQESYEKLSPYEIEDADFEEIRSKRKS